MLRTKAFYMRTRPISISRSNPATFTPAVLPPTDYLQLPAPVSTSSGSQQLRRFDQGVCKPDTAVKKFELLANVGTWLKESSTCATVSPFEQARAASARRTLDQCSFPYSRPTEFTLAYLCTHPHFAIIPDRNRAPSQLSVAERQQQPDRLSQAEAPALLNAPRQFYGG